MCSSDLAISQPYVISTFAGGAPPPTPASAANSAIGGGVLSGPQGVITDAAGNVYFSSLNCVFKVDTAGVLTLIAGNSRPGYSGDGGLAVAAQLNRPGSVAVDSAGNVFIADIGNVVVRKVSPSGIITTVAGTGSNGGPAGEGGPAINASLFGLSGIALDAAGNLYIAAIQIRKVSSNGIITTVASPPSNNGGGLAVDGAGNAYFSTGGSAGGIVQKVSPTGTITTVAGNGTMGFSGDGGPATSAQLNTPLQVGVDSAGNLYIVDRDNARIRKVSPNGIISTVAGGGTQSPGDGGPATSAAIGIANSVAVDPSGNIYICTSDAATIEGTSAVRVRKVSPSGIITTVAGGGFQNIGDGGLANKAQLNAPFGVSVDNSGNLMIADTGNNRIRRVSSSGVIASLSGTGFCAYSGDGAPAANAQLCSPYNITLDSSGNVYVADFNNVRIRKISTSGTISTVAGNGNCCYSGDGGSATSASIYAPAAVAWDSSGDLYIADYYNARIRKVSAAGVITTVAGNGSSGYSGDGGPATSAQISNPTGVAVDSAGNLYFVDYGTHTVRKVSTSGTISTIAGNGKPGYSGDGGLASSALLNQPLGIAIDAGGNLYIADGGNSVLRKIATSGIISTVAGNGTAGYSGDGGPAASAQLSFPTGVAVDSTGRIYISDRGNNAIRLLQPVSVGVSSVTNGASNISGPVSPGEIVVISGSGLGPAQLAQYHIGTSGIVETQLAGTQVFFNGTPAPIIYTWATQVAAVVPYSLSGVSAQVTVSYQGQPSGAVSVPIAASAPGIFTLDSTGKGPAAVVNQDGSINSASTPAKAGDFISIYATGEGQTSPTGIDGKPATVPLPQPNLSVTVTIGGQVVKPQYAGGAYGEVAGVLQVNEIGRASCRERV